MPSTPLHELVWSWSPRPESESAFAAMMLATDEFLALSGCPPHRRGWWAESLVSRALGFSVSLGGPLSMFLEPPKPWCPSYIVERMRSWYASAYGVRASTQGHMLALCVLKGTPWRLNVPMIFGTIPIVADADLTVGAGHGKWNVLRSIENAGPEIIAGLSIAERDHVLDVALLAFDAVLVLGSSDDALAAEATADYVLSVESLVGGPSLNSALWLTAQCMEKMLKFALRRLNVVFPYIHSIPELAKLLKTHAPFAATQEDLARVDCRAGVRYGEGEATVADALAAHYALLRCLICIRGPLGQPLEGASLAMCPRNVP